MMRIGQYACVPPSPAHWAAGPAAAYLSRRRMTHSFRPDSLPRALLTRHLRFGVLAAGLGIPFVAAGAEGPAPAGEVAPQPVPGASGSAQQRAPADTVDSLTAFRRATVMDT